MENVASYLSQTDTLETRPCETIDARELPPPQSLKNTLEQLTEIGDSIVLVQLNDRRPQHLYPKLDDREVRPRDARKRGHGRHRHLEG